MIFVKIVLTLIITIVASYILFHNISSPQAQHTTKYQRIGKIGLSILTIILLIIVIINDSFTTIDNKEYQKNSAQSLTTYHSNQQLTV